MDEKDKVISALLMSIYYMMGLVEASGCKAPYDFVLSAVETSEKLLYGGGVDD